MQLLKLSLIAFGIFSLSGCGPYGPKVKVCILSPEEQLLRCYDARTDAPSQIKLAESENYVCLSPADFKTLLEYYKRNKTK